MSEQLFINPYNFIPFGSSIEKKRRSREAAYQDRESLISGWLTVDLDTKTPLIIPDGAHPKYWDCERQKYIENPGSKQKKDLHREYDFMRIPDENGVERPVVPGSEIRGMLRSVYEAATDSCVPFLLSDKPISQRIPVLGSMQKRGLLAYERINPESEERRWVLYSTDEERVSVGRNFHGKVSDYKNGDYVTGRGWLQYNIPVNLNKNYHITYLKEKEPIYKWDFLTENGEIDNKRNEEPYRLLKAALNRKNDGERRPEERGENRNGSPNEIPNRNIYNALERAKKGGDNKIPVYYREIRQGEETFIYLSNSSIGRIGLRRGWQEIMGSHAPCNNTERLCPACLLFGTIQDKGLKGHIRFTDAVPVSHWESKRHTLQILGEPKATAFEFYQKKPKGNRITYWNFDFYGQKVRLPGEKQARIQYSMLDEAAPRGRKMYWHSPTAEDTLKTNMNTTTETIEGSFEFQIYFDQITRKQLQDLIWVITLGENQKDSTKQHKLGHAKPLGYGSVKLTIREETIRKIRKTKDSFEIKLVTVSGDRLSTTPGQETDLNENAVCNLLAMCNTRSVPGNIPVMYPKAMDNKGNEFIYQWFSDNRINPKYLQVLPEILDKDLTLSGYWKNGKTFDLNGQKKTGQEGTHKTVGNALPSRISGKVKFFKADQNYGYITGEDGQDYKISLNSYNPDIGQEDLIKGRYISFIPQKKGEKKFANHCEPM